METTCSVGSRYKDVDFSQKVPTLTLYTRGCGHYSESRVDIEDCRYLRTQITLAEHWAKGIENRTVQDAKTLAKRLMDNLSENHPEGFSEATVALLITHLSELATL